MISNATLFTGLQTDLAGNRIAELARNFGSPLRVYDIATIARNLDEASVFETVRYSFNACASLAILDRIRRRGAVASVSNAGEIRRALAAGFTPSRGGSGGETHGICYASDIFDRPSLDLVVESGLHVCCGAADMIDQLGQRQPGAEISLSIHPGVGDESESHLDSDLVPFSAGIRYEQVEDCLFKADQYGITITGLHMLIRSDANMDEVDQVCEAMKHTVSVVGRTVTRIGIKGEPPRHSSRDGAFDSIASFHRSWDLARLEIAELVGHKVDLEINLGRYAIAESISVIAEVRAVKKIGDMRYYLVEAGVGDLLLNAKDSSDFKVAICPRDGANHERPEVDAIVCGSATHSTNLAVLPNNPLAASRRLPIALVGDYVVISGLGTCGFAQSRNVHDARPMEIMIDQGKAEVIRARETYDDLVRGEVIPD